MPASRTPDDAPAQPAVAPAAPVKARTVSRRMAAKLSKARRELFKSMVMCFKCGELASEQDAVRVLPHGRAEAEPLFAHKSCGGVCDECLTPRPGTAMRPETFAVSGVGAITHRECVRCVKCEEVKREKSPVMWRNKVAHRTCLIKEEQEEAKPFE